MDILTNKSYKQYDYTSRYTTIPYYYNKEDDKWIYGISKNLNKDTQYIAHKVKDSDTLDYLALKYYNNPTYYWVIAYFNDIQDCYINLIDYYKIIKIPKINSIEFSEGR